MKLTRRDFIKTQAIAATAAAAGVTLPGAQQASFEVCDRGRELRLALVWTPWSVDPEGVATPISDVT